LLLGLSSSSHAVERLLIKDGQPRAEIVIAEKPARMAKLAAKELQAFVGKSAARQWMW